MRTGAMGTRTGAMGSRSGSSEMDEGLDEGSRGGRSSGQSRSGSGLSAGRSMGGQQSRGRDATAILKEDHQKVSRLFKQFEDADDPSRKQQIFRNIKNELEVHAAIEEEIFYREAGQEAEGELREQLEEAHGEHNKVKELLAKAAEHDPDSGEFDAGVAAIKGAVEHHVEEEENEMFKEIRKTFSADELKEIGARMEARKKQLMMRGSRELVGA
jgi:hemerythrin-like domain-containing protein